MLLQYLYSTRCHGTCEKATFIFLFDWAIDWIIDRIKTEALLLLPFSFSMVHFNLPFSHIFRFSDSSLWRLRFSFPGRVKHEFCETISYWLSEHLVCNCSWYRIYQCQTAVKPYCFILIQSEPVQPSFRFTLKRNLLAFVWVPVSLSMKGILLYHNSL